MRVICNFNQKHCSDVLELTIHKTTGEKMEHTQINGIIFLSMDVNRNPYVNAVSVSMRKSPITKNISFSIGDDRKRIRTYESVSHIKYNEKLSFYQIGDSKYLCVLIPNSEIDKKYTMEWYGEFFKLF